MHTALAPVPLRRVLIVFAAFTAACSTDKANSAAERDSALAKDLALAGQQTSQAPTFQDTSVAPATVKAAKQPNAELPAVVHRKVAQKPKAQAPQQVAQAPTPIPSPVVQMPAPVAAAPLPVHGEIGAGSGFSMTSGSKVCTTSNLPGDKLVATVNETVTGTNGAVIPAGSTVVLEIASITGGDNADAAKITFRVRSVVVDGKNFPASADVTTTTPLDKTKVAGNDPNADKKKVIGGAIVGAILGQMIGHNTKGTIIGAAAGAAGGAAVAKTGERWEGCLPSGAAMHLTFNSGLVMS